MLERTAPSLMAFMSFASSLRADHSVRSGAECPFLSFPFLSFPFLSNPPIHATDLSLSTSLSTSLSLDITLDLSHTPRMDVFCSWCCETELQPGRHCYQLGRWPAPREEERSVWLLLHQRHCPWYPRAPQVSSHSWTGEGAAPASLTTRSPLLSLLSTCICLWFSFSFFSFVLLSHYSPGVTSAFCTLTLTFITAMVLRRLFTAPTAS